MDTADFLRLILPSDGVRVIVTLPNAKHYCFDNDDDAAACAVELARNHNVYHACATYIAALERPRGARGDDSNWQAAKAFWVDLDVDATDPKKYPSPKEAMLGLVTWCKTAGLPTPTLWVSSGYGVHAYWVLTSQVSLDSWKETSSLLKACLAHGNVLADPARTADHKTILRPPGTYNYKQAHRQPVTVIGAPKPALDVHGFVTPLLTYQRAHHVAVSGTRKPPTDRSVADANNDLVTEVEYPLASAKKAADACAQLGAIRDARGHVSEPLWRGMLGLVKHCVEGLPLAQEWSNGHPEYDASGTEQKYERWATGPTTCDYFRTHNSAGCADCPHALTSPITLGELPPEHTDAIEVNPADGVINTTIQMPFPRSFPTGIIDDYKWDKGKNVLLARKVEKTKDAAGKTTWETSWEPFCDVPLLGKRYYARGGSYYVEMHLLHRGKWRDVEIPCALIAAGGSKLHEDLGRQLVYSKRGGKLHMEGYLNAWVRELKKEADEVQQFQQFGWTNDNSFLVGNRLYHPDGSVETVLLGGDAAELAQAFTPHGDLERWKTLVNRAYNYPNQEQYQMMLCVGFGSPLLKLMNNYKGVTLHATTTRSAEGKTTVGRVALSIWGEPNPLALTWRQTTELALYSKLGTYNSLPLLVDEITNIKSLDASKFMYSVSDGKQRIVLGTDGRQRKVAMPWTTLVLTTGNRSLVSSVGADKASAEAEIVRCAEFRFERISQLSKIEADALFDELAQHWGLAGDVYARYMVTHREEIAKLLSDVQLKFDAAARISRKERFWSAAFACILTGALIAKKLGLIAFDVSGMMKWMVMQVTRMRLALRDNTSDLGEVWHTMLTELTRSIIVTESWGDLRTGKPVEIKNSISGNVISGRTVMAEQATYLPQTVVRKWCSDRQVDYTAMIEFGRAEKWLDPKLIQVSLGKGTGYTTAPAKCFKLLRDKLGELDSVDVRPVSLVVDNT